MVRLKSLIAQLYKEIQPKPLLLAPGGFYDKVWFEKFLDVSGPTTVNALTHHIYNLGPGKLIKFTNHYSLSMFYFYVVSMKSYWTKVSINSCIQMD